MASRPSPVSLRSWLDQFGRRIGVARRADGVRAAARNGVDPVRAAGQARHQFGKRGFHVVARRTAVDGGAAQPVEQHVAVFVVVPVGEPGSVLQQDMAFQAEARRGGRRLAGVVGLDRALGGDGFGPAFQRRAHQEFQLARLVAAGREPRAVVPLDPDLRPVKRRRSAVRAAPAASADARGARAAGGRDSWRCVRIRFRERAGARPGRPDNAAVQTATGKVFRVAPYGRNRAPPRRWRIERRWRRI